jgi:hypothetical protein
MTMRDKQHDGQLFERLNQLIKVESPIKFESICRWCPDVRPWQLADALSDLWQCGRISVTREWKQGRMIETYHYGAEVSDAGVILADDEAIALHHQAWEQLSLVA